MRKPIIAGNWKMNKTLDEALKLVEELKPLVKDAKCDVVICPPYICLNEIVGKVRGTNIKVGAQNMYYEESGAYTGEVSPQMLESIGIDYVIIGHSERRRYFAETDEAVNKKVKKAFEHNIIPIICCGETLEERESNVTREVLGRQIKLDLADLKDEEVEKLVVAYEPIWAIGTGKTATDKQANETIGYIRSLIASMYGEKTAEKTRIQYGGSVKPATIKAQMNQPEIDGALVGGASLRPADFSAIVNYEKN
ncbi:MULTISPECIES: triose-phosphate isomerase [Clostridium]|jgi:triosephosphate isomerase|uniref:Triosephosphate isomerase n=1 Tax=Clostridium lapidicellarium TaxID=3240931 RepID=A0ABV4E0Z0_9CLOT|nr:triose-phosphate isomerase [Clostridiales bacterium]